MTLLEHYHADVDHLRPTEKRVRKRHWHNAAKRYLVMLSLTADPLPPYHVNSDGVETRPIDQFFLRFPPEELIRLYRITKPRRRG